MDQNQSGRARGPKRKIFAIAGLLFAAFMTYRIFGVYSVRSGECSPGPDPIGWKSAGEEPQAFPDRRSREVRRLRVMSYNIEGHAALLRTDHLEGIAAVIREAKPDVAGLQEVHRGTWQSRFDDQALELSRRTGMNVFFGRSFENLGGEFGNAILTRGRIVSCNVHELPSVGEPRSLLQCEIRFEGETMNFYVTHLATWGSLNRASRLGQVECIEEHVKRSSVPYILAGDFNATPQTPEIRRLQKSGIVQQAGLVTEGTHKLTGQHLDYILPDLGWSIESTAVLKGGPSDHWPIVADLEWSRPAAMEMN